MKIKAHSFIIPNYAIEFIVGISFMHKAIFLSLGPFEIGIVWGEHARETKSAFTCSQDQK